MVEQEYGKIVMTSSIVALGNKGRPTTRRPRPASRLARTLALELGRFNINVNAVAPGWIETEMTKRSGRAVGHHGGDEGPLRQEHPPQALRRWTTSPTSSPSSSPTTPRTSVGRRFTSLVVLPAR